MIDYKLEDFNIKSLGSFYQKDLTTFRVFAPEYEVLYLSINNHEYKMHKKGMIFEIALLGDLHLKKYHYMTRDIEFKDPFSYLSIVNESIILDKNRFNIEVVKPDNYKEPIIYEMNVRDFSNDFNLDNKGKLLNIIQDNLNKDGYSIGFDYLKELGITHIQLMPIFNFDNDGTDYNWGYNPLDFNFIKDDYILNNDDPYAFINEFKEVVNKLHDNNIRVVLDVVFNHVYNVNNFDLEKMLPGHIFRYKEDGTLANGSLCGNEIKSEDIFVREYIKEMIRRYISIFDIDGLRFDLMGLIDIQTIKEIYQLSKNYKDDFILYGEGWNMGDILDDQYRSTINNAYQIENIYMFNDCFRDSLIYYLSGNNDYKNLIKDLISGNNNYLNEKQSINYVECHDEYTFYDRMILFKNDYEDELKIRRSKLALSLILIARGIPFIHSGQEFLRSKKGVRNSYNSPDEINQIDWNLRIQNKDLVNYIKDLIEFRKKHEEFIAEGINVYCDDFYECIMYYLNQLKIIINPTIYEYYYNDGQTYHILFDDNGFTDYYTNEIKIAYSSIIIMQNN